MKNLKKFLVVLVMLTFVCEQTAIFAATTVNNTKTANQQQQQMNGRNTQTSSGSLQRSNNMQNNNWSQQNYQQNYQQNNQQNYQQNYAQNYQYNNGQMNYNYDNTMMFEKPADVFANNYQNLSANTKLSYLSQIERMFNDVNDESVVKPLMQVGYEYFVAPISNNTELTGKFDDSYRFSIGEKINAYLYGDSVDVMAISGSSLLTPVVQTEVDSKGNIFIQGIGVVPAEGKSIQEVEESINRLAAGKYNNLKVKLNIAFGQDFSVFVYGQVNKPGKVVVNNNSSVMDALSAAGGVKKTGTLRKISYKSGKKTKEVDLYKAMFAGNDDDVILRPNDKIFVGGIGSVVAIKNGVGISGIYEIKENETLKDIVSFAGGLLPGTQLTDVTMTGLDTDNMERTAKNVSWSEASRTKLKNGDVIEFRDMYNVAENTVILQGNVKHPATYAYKPGMRLSDVLKGENELLEETFLTQAVIRRISGKDNAITTIPIFLKEFFAGVNDPVLQPRDVINVYKNTNSQFVDVYGCISMPKHITYTEGMNLDDVLTDVQFVDSKISEEDDEEVNVQKVSLNKDTEGNSPLVGSTNNDSRVISAENVACEITAEDGTTQLYYLYDIMIATNKIKEINLLPNDKIFFRTLRDNEFIKKVKVSGFVRHPGVFKFVEGKYLSDMIKMADGLTADADLRGIVYTRKLIKDKQVELAKKNADMDISLIEGKMATAFKASNTELEGRSDMITLLKEGKKEIENKYEGQIALNIKTQDVDKIRKQDNILVQDGDEIYIPRMSKHVSVIGEVYNEQSFMYMGRSVGKYIRGVGGYTPNGSRLRKYKIGVNGRARKIHLLTKIEPGDTIVIPRKVAGNDWITPICSTLSSIASIISTAFIVTKI